MHINISGLGAVGGFGVGIGQLMESLDRAAPSSGEPFRADTSSLADYVTPRRLRRIDRFSQLALLGAFSVLEDAEALDIDRERTGVIIATGYGPSTTGFAFLDSVLQDGCAMAAPIRFSSSVHNAAAGYISMIMGIKGPCLTVSQFEMSVPSALLTASIWLRDNMVDSVLIGGVDEYNDIIGHCRNQFFPEFHGAMEPLNFAKHTAVAGEGAGFLLLTTLRDSKKTYGSIQNIDLGLLQEDTCVGTKNGLTLLGADGHCRCGEYYAKHVHQEARVAGFGAYYGSFPGAHAIDLAIGALKLQVEKQVCCVKLSGEGECGSTYLYAEQ